MITILSNQDVESVHEIIVGKKYTVSVDSDKTKYDIVIYLSETINLSSKQIEGLIESKALKLKSMFEEKKRAPQN